MQGGAAIVRPEHDAVRAAKTQSLFREVNDRIRAVNEAFGFDELGEYLCECADAHCTDRIAMTVEEYAALRARRGGFAVVRGHELGEVDRIAERQEGYVIVNADPRPQEPDR